MLEVLRAHNRHVAVGLGPALQARHHHTRWRHTRCGLGAVEDVAASVQRGCCIGGQPSEPQHIHTIDARVVKQRRPPSTGHGHICIEAHARLAASCHSGRRHLVSADEKPAVVCHCDGEHEPQWVVLVRVQRRVHNVHRAVPRHRHCRSDRYARAPTRALQEAAKNVPRAACQYCEHAVEVEAVGSAAHDLAAQNVPRTAIRDLYAVARIHGQLHGAELRVGKIQCALVSDHDAVRHLQPVAARIAARDVALGQVQLASSCDSDDARHLDSLQHTGCSRAEYAPGACVVNCDCVQGEQ